MVGVPGTGGTGGTGISRDSRHWWHWDQRGFQALWMLQDWCAGLGSGMCAGNGMSWGHHAVSCLVGHCLAVPSAGGTGSLHLPRQHPGLGRRFLRFLWCDGAQNSQQSRSTPSSSWGKPHSGSQIHIPKAKASPWLLPEGCLGSLWNHCISQGPFPALG